MSILEADTSSNIETVKLLLENGADVNAKDVIGWTPLMMSSRYSNTDSNIQTVKLLLENGADVNAKYDKGWTPLMLASRYSTTDSNIQTVKLLLENGANVNLKNNAGWTPLILASKNSNTETVKLLLENGANINLKNNNGNTALMLTKNLETLKLLLEYNADPFILNDDGKSILEYCGSEECKNIINLAIWKRLFNRDMLTAKQYSKQTALPSDVWEIILLNKRQQQLCKDLSSDKNREILALFALELNIPIDENVTKAKLCGLISRQLAYGKYYTEKGKEYTEDKIKKEIAQIKKIARNFGLEVNRPLDEILKDLSFLMK
jgi:hypothetical protein